MCVREQTRLFYLIVVMEENAARIRKRRGAYRGNVTKIVNDIEELLVSEEVSVVAANNELLALKNNLVDRIEKVKELDDQLDDILIDGGDDIYQTFMDDTLEYHSQFYHLFVRIDERLSSDVSLKTSRRNSFGSQDLTTHELCNSTEHLDHLLHYFLPWLISRHPGAKAL